MNGSLQSSPDFVDIKLRRGPAGLGFNIIGGVDQQYTPNDNGIYVSKIKEDGAAAQDGRLKEGDKIVAINGTSLANLTHKAVVALFRTAGEDVELSIQKKQPSHMNGPKDSQPEHNSPVSYLGMLALLAGAVAILAVIYKRHK